MLRCRWWSAAPCLWSVAEEADTDSPTFVVAVPLAVMDMPSLVVAELSVQVMMAPRFNWDPLAEMDSASCTRELERR